MMDLRYPSVPNGPPPVQIAALTGFLFGLVDNLNGEYDPGGMGLTAMAKAAPYDVEAGADGYWGKPGCVWSRYGNTAGELPPADNYFLGIDHDGGLHIGVQPHGSKDITWRTI